MGLEIADEQVEEITGDEYVLQVDLAKTEDGEIVNGNDVRAAYVYKGVGQRISKDEAKELGLLEEKKQAPKPADKKRTPAKNKAKATKD